jgi:hypothetical protein
VLYSTRFIGINKGKLLYFVTILYSINFPAKEKG